MYFAKLWPSFRPLAVGGERWIVAERHQIWVSFAGMSGDISRGDVIVTRICTEPPVAASIGTGAIEGRDAIAICASLRSTKTASSDGAKSRA